MVSLRKINEDNYREILDMKLPDTQRFVAPNVLSLAQAWVFYDSARPMAIYYGEKAVGFLMLGYDYEKKEADIWRLMIKEDEQSKGYGTQAILLALDIIRGEGKFQKAVLSYVPGNASARHVYEKLGFKETGEVNEGEIVMELPL